MSLPCRLVIVDAQHQLAGPNHALGQAVAAPLPAAVLTEFGVMPRASPLQLAADSARLRAVLPSLARQPGWQLRLALHEQHQLVAILEARPGAAVSPAADAATAALLRFVSLPPASPLPADLSGPPPKTVVFVEDDATVRTVCRRILQDRCLVLEAAAGAAALTLGDWLPWPADLLISDINLPKMDGVTLAERWLERWHSTRVLLLSGSFFPEVAAGLPLVFLQKPFHADELLHCAEMLLGDSSLRAAAAQ